MSPPPEQQGTRPDQAQRLQTKRAHQPAAAFSVCSYPPESVAEKQDWVAVEEPLETRLVYHAAGQKRDHSICVTMRTPGNDIELTLGFLFTEGIITCLDEIESVEHCGPGVPDSDLVNVVKVVLQPGCSPDTGRLMRNFFTSSSCGVCGKTSIAALKQQSLETRNATFTEPEHERFTVAARHLLDIPRLLHQQQSTFQKTGGLHAAGLFSRNGELILVREDVGRHNALDKLVGCALQQGRLPWQEYGVMLSGRISFELIQKVAMAGGRMIAAIGPPSSLAIEAAEEFHITLAGFLKADAFNLYSHAERVAF